MKRKRGHVDAIQRQLSNSRSNQGRGSLSGWVTCPLCVGVSRRTFALGRGIADHLQSVHAPWEPSRVEIKKRRRMLEREEKNVRRRGEQSSEPRTRESKDVSSANDPPPLERWEPTTQEIEEWNARVIGIVRDLEARASGGESSDVAGPGHAVMVVAPGKDRTGNVTVEYRESLPEFLRAAADGNLSLLQQSVNDAAVQEQQGGESSSAVTSLLGTKDRHLSTAEHWAAGSGHLDCLRYLVETRRALEASASPVATRTGPALSGARTRPKLRRRDGKTALHFAARNGRTDCIRYLLKERVHDVDEASGDGTTPLHLACFGGQVDAFDVLVEHGASVAAKNEWGCDAAHWMGMTRCECKDDVWRLCNRLAQGGVTFVEQQKQGHTALHKAAQRKNRHVIEWMAGSKADGGAGLSVEERRLAARPDDGGHIPSDIWRSVDGDPAFGAWMRAEMQW